MWYRIAKWYEWVFGTILLTILGVIFTLQHLSPDNQWVLFLFLFLFLVASTARMIDDAKRHQW